MKTTLRNTLASVMLMACSSLSAQQKITDRASLSAAALAPASDVLGIVDVSAGVAGSKKITIDDLFTGWGTTTAGATLMKAASAAAQRSALGLGTAATTSAGAYEPSLGTPGTDGFLLSSTTAGVRSWVAPASGGNVAIASEGEAEVGTDNTKLMTPLRTHQTLTYFGLGQPNNGYATLGQGLIANDVIATNLTSQNLTITEETLFQGSINFGLLNAAIGDLYFRDALGNLSGLPIGTDGQVLKVDGASGYPAWANPQASAPASHAASHEAGGSDPIEADNIQNILPVIHREVGSDTVIAYAAQRIRGANNGDLGLSYQDEAGTWFVGHPEAFATALGLTAMAYQNESNFERNLGNPPDGSGYLLSSNDAGMRTWIPRNFEPDLGIPVITGSVLTSNNDGIRSWVQLGAFEPLLGNPATDGQVLSSTAAGVRSWITPGGGLTHFTESVTTAAPNASIPAVRLLATNAATNVDMVLQPKGNGSLMATLPNSAASGGNKRGLLAVDWQLSRTLANEVASGNTSVVGGGYANRASGDTATVSGGQANLASGTRSTAIGGNGNTASGGEAIAGGNGNTASGTQSVAMGNGNTASGEFSAVFGNQNTASGSHNFAVGSNNTLTGSASFVTGRYATNRGIVGTFVQASGAQSNLLGVNQAARYVLYTLTSDATVTELQTSSSTGTRTVVMPNNSTYSFTGQVSARSSTGDSAAWRFSGSIERGGNAASTVLIGTPTTTDTNAEAGAASWTISVNADTSAGGLRIQATGAVAATIRWTALIETSEVVY